MRPGPGEYVPDSTEGITRVEDLPTPLVRQRSRDYPRRRCPHCGRSCYRHARGQRSLHDLGCLSRDRPCVLHVTYSRHYCARCRRHFSAPLADLAPPGSHYTHRVISLAVRLVVEDGLPYRAASWHLWRDHRVFVPFATVQNWVEAAGEKKQRPTRHHVS
jgi:transposase